MGVTVLITYEATERHREIIAGQVGSLAEVKYLNDFNQRKRTSAIKDAEVLIGWSPERELGQRGLQNLTSAGLYQLLSAGADHVPFKKLPKKMIVASNAGAYAQPMAEHVMAMALALAKRLPEKHKELEEGVFDSRTRNKGVQGSIWGIVGFGGTGKTVARLTRAFGSHIHAVNTSGKSQEPADLVVKSDRLPEVLEVSDYLVLTLPLNRHTRGMIGAKELATMKKDAVLINVARGEIVEQDALYEHLVANPEFMAGVDAWWTEPMRHGEFKVDYPFFDLPNFLGSPHNSPLVPGSISNAVRLSAENVRRFIKGEQTRGVINPSDYI